MQAAKLPGTSLIINADEVDYETTKKGEPEKSSVISQKSLATFIAAVGESPEKYSQKICL